MKAYELVQKGWCQKVHAKDSNGAVIYNLSDMAVLRCAYAALEYVYRAHSSKFTLITQNLRDYLNVSSIICWNDDPERTQEEVVEALKAVEGE